MIAVDESRFEQMVTEALDGLPERFGRLMRNIAVTVADGDDPHLLGLYQGVPVTARTNGYSAVMPDRITIFRLAICGICNTEAQVVDQVRRTVVHEVGHYFGIGDERLHELGY